MKTGNPEVDAELEKKKKERKRSWHRAFCVTSKICTLASHRFRHFCISPIRLHSAALSLTFLRFFDVSQSWKRSLRAEEEHTHMADIRRAEQM